MSEFRAKLNPFTGNLQLIPNNIVLAFKAGVATQALLPLAGNAKGDARIANDTGHLYVWSIDAPAGLLTDWVDAGDIVDLTWAAISGKPTSAVADIDDAVTKRHSQDTDQYLTTPVTNVLYVDGNRTDALPTPGGYTPNGSITKPFLTIQAAINAASSGCKIIIGAGSYTETITININLFLQGQNNYLDFDSTLTSGLITITDSSVVIKDICINGGMTMGIRVVGSTSNLFVENCYINSLIECAGEFVGNHLNFGFGKLKIIGIAGYILSKLSDSYMIMTGDHVLVELTGTDHLVISDTTIIGYNTLSTGVIYMNGSGQLQLRDVLVQNSSGTKAIVLNSAGGVGLFDVVAIGDIDCNVVPTFIEGLIQPSGILTGSTISYRPASKLNNDSSVIGTTVKDALNTLDGKIIYTSEYKAYEVN